MYDFSTIAELTAEAEKNRLPISSIVIAREAHDSQRSYDEVVSQMRASWLTMKKAIDKGIRTPGKSVSGLTGGDAPKIFSRLSDPEARSYLGNLASCACAGAIAVAEVSAGMGRIVACPTAGSCGIVPGALYAAHRYIIKNDEAIVRALFTAAGFGMVIDRMACIAGAEGGCQAECGTAAAMAAAALTELGGGTPEAAAHAAALALKNLLGLACDPVAGLVEVPCIKRNGFIAVHALTAADMALTGIRSVIPPDEVIMAMKEIGDLLPLALKETAAGGLAATLTGRRLKEQIFGKQSD